MEKHALDRNTGIWIELSDRLFFAAYSGVASLVVRFSGYFRRLDGEIVQYAYDIAPTADRVVTSRVEFFGAGFLLSCVASLATGTAPHGQCYARAQVQRSTGGAVVKLHNILGGYVSEASSPSFPYGRIDGPLEGAGALRSVTGSDPAAGAEIAETVPTGVRWRVMHIRVVLVTDGTVANRTALFIFDDGTNGLTRSQLGTAMTASATWNVILAPWGYTGAGGTSTLQVPMPLPITLPGGSRFSSTTNNFQAGDNWGPPQFLIEEWIEG